MKSNTVRSSGRGSGIGDKHNWDTIEVQKEGQSNIRKLTPVECERLQCLPDNYTSCNGEISNAQRYKMLGNAFNVDVIAHILKFIN